MIEQNPDGSNRRSGTRTGIFSPISGKICCINEINCHLLQKRNRKAPGYGLRITEIKKNGIWHADVRPENRAVRGRTIRFPDNRGDWHKNCS